MIRKIITIGTLCIGALALSACDARVSQHTLLLGDSITTLCAPEIISDTHMRELGIMTTFETVPGSSFKDYSWYWDDRIDSILENSSFDSVIIELGTNDFRAAIGINEDYFAIITNIVEKFPAEVDILIVRPDPTSTWLESIYFPSVDQAITDVAATHPNVTISSFLATAPDNYYTAKTPHLNNKGCRAYSAHLVTQLDALNV